MFLAAVETVRHMLMVLPGRSHLPLQFRISIHFRKLLELVYAHDNTDTLVDCNPFGKIENLRLVFLDRIVLEIDGEDVI